mgnify:CR=1 FL=1
MENKIALQIKDLSEDDRPREKLIRHGASTLSDAELLAIIIGSGTKGRSAIHLAQEILKNYNHDLNKIAIQHPFNLMENIKGLGKVKCINIIAALELSKRRYVQQYLKKDDPLNSPEKSAYYLFRYLSDKTQEEFYAIYLNNACIPIDITHISTGTVNLSLVDIQKIVRYALINNAVNVIVAHNHPSGNLTPSQEDIRITHKIKEALKLFNIQLLDHLIIYQNQYLSFADKSIL